MVSPNDAPPIEPWVAGVARTLTSLGWEQARATAKRTTNVAGDIETTKGTCWVTPTQARALIAYKDRDWLPAKHSCAWCNERMLVRRADRKQRCPNDCASGLGACPEHLLPDDEPESGATDGLATR